MPELPEVETIRRQLEPVLVGQKFVTIEVLRDKSWSGEVSRVIGQEIVGVRRKAKVLIIDTGQKPSATSHLLVHLKMTGQLIYEPSAVCLQQSAKQPAVRSQSSAESLEQLAALARIVGGHPNNSWTAQLPDKHTRVVFGLNQGTLFFNDMRVFGWVKQVTSEKVQEIISLMPPDIIDLECTPDYFYQILQRSSRPVKLVILDSHKVGGIGNIYANDGLFLAGIDPRRAANSLTKRESNKLLEALKEVVNLGIQLGGATMADGKFVNTKGYGGKYQDHFLVYEREGELVEHDGKSGYVEKFKLGGRGTYWVRGLQT